MPRSIFLSKDFITALISGPPLNQIQISAYASAVPVRSVLALHYLTWIDKFLRGLPICRGADGSKQMMQLSPSH